ncbi:MAG TPA: hypothetical protein PLZ52_06725 [Bacteroidales bacterium]|mgnify:FL=1|nr:hypothetical protein [Bacteroidales bacterium]
MKVLLFCVAFGLFAFSCGELATSPKEKDLQDQLAKLQSENKNLKKQESEKDEAIKSFVGTLNEISVNLELIKQKENIISLAAVDVELNSTEIESISRDILLINELMDKNRRTIDLLNRKLSESVIYSEELQQVIDNFTLIVDRQETEINQLNEQLKKMSSRFVLLQHSIDSLNQANQRQQEKIAEHENMMNTGYYIAGTAGELTVLDIISSAGGVLGVGGIYLVNEDFDKEEFNKVVISETRKIPLNCRSAKLLSVHPSFSYKFDGPPDYINNLIITRPREFWSNTKYLVVLKK